LVLTNAATDARVHVCYDDCCKLATYAVMREPNLFGQWRWFIDRLHYLDHTACSRCLDLNRYPFGDVNSETCEQLHSVMGKLRGQLAGMSQHRAAFYLRHFLWCLNVKTGKVIVAQSAVSASGHSE
jgi:hypothetical protein